MVALQVSPTLSAPVLYQTLCTLPQFSLLPVGPCYKKAYTICIFVYYEFAKKPPVLMSLPASDTLGNADITAYHGPT